MSAVRIGLQALFSLPLRPLPLYRRPLRRPGPIVSLPPPPPPSEGQGVAGEALGVSRACSSFSFPPLAHALGEGGSVVAGSGAVSFLLPLPTPT